MLAKLDVNNDGQIDYNEFITAAMDSRQVSDEMIRKTFNILDYDKNGTIEADELQYAFKSRGTNKEKESEETKF